MIYVKYSTDAGVPSFKGSAGSLITLLDYCLVTTAGWSKEFTGTNLATYRAPAGLRLRLGVDDTTTTTARVRGFETMTTAGVAVASGTGPYPTDTQLSGGGYFYKSSDTSTARWWVFAGNDRCFWLIVYSGVYYGGMFFGDISSYKNTTDSYASMIICDHTGSSYGSNVAYSNGTLSTSYNGHFLARGNAQTGTSVTAGKFWDIRAATSGGSGGLPYPDPVTGGIVLTQANVNESAASLCRGKLPGLWIPCHNRPITHGDTFTGSGALAGRTFVALNIFSNMQVMLETSDTWYS